MSAGAKEPLRFRRAWFALGLVLLVAVLAGSLANLPAPIEQVMLYDKWLHFSAYATLMLWFAQVFRPPLARLLLAIVLIAFGVGIEYLQGMTQTRQPEAIDVLANATGVLVGGALAWTPAGRTFAAVERLLSRPSPSVRMTTEKPRS